jgi:HK97 family phage prohead protease
MEKSFGVESVEPLGESGSGQFEALVSVFGNIDADGDVVMPGAFTKAIKEQEPPPIVWSHFWNIPPIGETLDWSEGSVGGKDGLRIKGALFVGADDRHQYADMVYAGMKSRDGRKPALREFSFQYDIPDGGAQTATRETDGKTQPVQELLSLYPIGEVGPCLRGANRMTELLVAPKSFKPEHLKRLERVAKARGVEIEELLAELEAEQGESVRDESYAPQVAELLLAFPDH